MKTEEQIRLKYKLTQQNKKNLQDKLANSIREQEKCQAKSFEFDNLIKYLSSQIEHEDIRIELMDWVLETKITAIGSIM